MKDMERIRKNCIAFFQKKYWDHEEAVKALSSLQKDGSWQDIDYADQNRSSWRSSVHLTRLQTMAAAWSCPGTSLYHSEELGEGIQKGLTFWTKEKRTAANWWWNDIFVPMTLGQISLLASGLFRESTLLKGILPYLEQAKFGMTGQNRIWLAQGVMYRALLLGDEDLLDKVHKEFLAEIVYGKTEGIRRDGAFHQHGPQLQFGNYGLSYLESIAVLMTCLAGSRWALTRIVPFRDYILNGLKWVVWKEVMDITAMGRQVWKDTQLDKTKRFYAAIALLVKADPAFAAAYKKAPLGNRMFFSSDYMVHRMKDFYASFRATSRHTFAVETYVNDDNLLGKYLSDGVMQVMLTGEEYLNIASCWSWTRLPGTTLPDTPRYTKEESRQRGLVTSSNEPPEVTHCTFRRLQGESLFTGGVSDGKKYGAMVHVMDLDQVKAKKAVFFAGDMILALGCGITSSSPFPVATTVEQNLLRGEVRKGEDWFYHNHIGYAGKNMTLFTGKCQGDWKPTWGGYKESFPDEKEIFRLTIEHGMMCENDSYEYKIFPGAAPEEMPLLVNSCEVLANNEKIQAVRLKNGTIMAIFHKKGSLGSFSTDAPGVFIIGKKRIFAADPAKRKRIFHLTFGGKIYKVVLPRGDFAGSTVMIERKEK